MKDPMDLPSDSQNEPSKSIQAIDKNAVHRICSGQVVLNLAIAVKELVENSLDAGATVIGISLKEHGSELIEVVDNGCGVEDKNFEALTLKYHTSKLREFTDLFSVETFGFRGEALSSLCAVSDLSVITRHASATCGTKLDYDNKGHIISQKPCARQIGTTVTLQNIFYTLPVRQKEFHRNLQREFSKMVQILYAYCLVSTGVKITCRNQVKKRSLVTVVSTQGSGTVRENIACVYGSKQVQSVMEITQTSPSNELLQELGISETVLSEENPFKVEGFVSSCAHGQGRSAGDRQFYYINSRPCEPQKVARVVTEVYHHFNKHQHPFVFINIKMAQCNVDVNLTPDKRQVFVEKEKLLVATVKASLLSLYESVPSTYKLQNVSLNPVTVPSATSPRTSLSDMLKQWSHSSAVNSSPPSTTTKTRNSLKRGLELIRSETNREAKQLCVKNFFSLKDQDINERHDANKLSEDMEISNNKDTNKECSLTNDEVSNLSMLEVNDNCDYKTEIDDGLECRGSTKESNVLATDSSKLSTVTILNELESDIEDQQLNSRTVEHIEIEKEIPSEVLCDNESCHNSERYTVSATLSIESLRERLQQLSKKTINKRKIKSDELLMKFLATIHPSKNKTAECELQREISKDMFAKMEIIGQFNLGFIITKLDSDLFIIDQHATDEIYNFETLQKTTTLQNQRLVMPQQLELTYVNECSLIENLEVFRKNGFEFTINESAEPTKRVKLTSIPLSKNWTFGQEDIDELLFMLKDAPNTMCRPSRVRAMFASRACRMSVMIGSALSLSDMRRLVNHMGEIEQPWNCPHGRPTMRHLVNMNYVYNRWAQHLKDEG